MTGFDSKRAAAADKLQEPHGYDWSMLEAAQESLREHMARIKELEAQLAQPAQDWKTLPKKDAPLVEWANEQTPPKRPWVGLTDGEVSEAYKAAWKKAEFGMGIERKDVYEAIEAKLKEKNNG